MKSHRLLSRGALSVAAIALACGQTAGDVDTTSAAGGEVGTGGDGGTSFGGNGGGAGTPPVVDAAPPDANAPDASVPDSGANCAPIEDAPLAPELVGELQFGFEYVVRLKAADGELLLSTSAPSRGGLDFGGLYRFEEPNATTRVGMAGIGYVPSWDLGAGRLWVAGDPVGYFDLPDIATQRVVAPPFAAGRVVPSPTGLLFLDGRSLYVWPSYTGQPRPLATLDDGQYLLGPSPGANAAWYAFASFSDESDSLHRITYDGSSNDLVVELDDCCSLDTPLAIPGGEHDAAYVANYVSGTGEYDVSRVSATGERLAWGRGPWVDLAIDEDFLYWIEEFTVKKKRHCGGEAAVVANLPQEPSLIAVDGKMLWILVRYGPAPTLYRVTLP